MNRTSTVIKVEGVSQAFGAEGDPRRVVALESATLDIPRGELLSLIGPSGCGKSTLLNILGTLDLPDAGEILFDGEALASLKPAGLAAVRSQKIGFIFQLHHLMPQCSVLENVLLPTLALFSADAICCASFK